MKFNAKSTATEVLTGIDLSCKNILITGVTSGIGVETAKSLARSGANLILCVRDINAGRGILQSIGSGNHMLVEMNLCDFDSIKLATKTIGQKYNNIDILICNAGASKTPQTHLENGIDVRFAGNHLGHFLLCNLLFNQLAKNGSRIVMLSSGAHKNSPICLEDLEWRKREHSIFKAYGESKTANILFAIEATNRWQEFGIFANTVLPGTIMTGLQRYHGDELKRQIGFFDKDGKMDPIIKSIEQGAATSVWAATSLELDKKGGLVLEDCDIAQPYNDTMHKWSGIDTEVINNEDASKLWNASLNILAQWL